MNHHLTIAYLTSRKDSKVEWFLQSLRKQHFEHDMRIVIVDFHGNTGKTVQEFCSVECNRPMDKPTDAFITIVKPKPCVWQGEHRLTRENWFAASNARNTALCLARGDWIAYVDDLSVLMPGWLDCIREAMEGGYIVLGSYEKRKNMVVENGVLISSDPSGTDSRLSQIKDHSKPHHVDGGWLYGCSLAGPVESFLSVNGWPEFVDGLSSEDYCMGLALYNAGHKLMFDPRMKTVESEELHFVEAPMRRSDKGVSPADKSHAALNIAKQSKWFPNYFGDEGIRGLRQRVLKGESFPIMGIPEHDWFDGQPIKDMI